MQLPQWIWSDNIPLMKIFGVLKDTKLPTEHLKQFAGITKNVKKIFDANEQLKISTFIII